MTRRLDAGVVAERDYDSWDRFVSAQSRTGSIFSTARYLDILCRAAGGSFSIAAVRDGNDFVGGVGLYCRHVGGRAVIAPRMLLSYNGWVLRDDLLSLQGSSSRRLDCLAALCAMLTRQPVEAIDLRCRDGDQDFRPFLDNRWRAAPSYTIEVPIADTGHLWERFDRNARRLVRRADQAGCTVAPDNDFDAFYRSHEEIHRRKGSQLYLPREAFRCFFEDLVRARLGAVFTARVASGEPAAAQLVLLGAHPCCHTVCAGSFPQYLSTGASYLLRWRAFVELGGRGYATNDLTNASLGPVTRFKEQLGGTLKMDMSLRWRRSGLDRLMMRGAAWARALRLRP